MYAEERQQAMAELVTRRGRVSVVELAQTFEVTTETVRRDLSTLETLGLIRRVHGGALPPESITLLEARLSDRDLANIEAKTLIARAAMRFVPAAESTLIIDAGSTTIRMAELLPKEHRLTVFTHAVPVASRLADQSHVELHLLPGRVRRRTLAAVGVETVEALRRIRADVAFVGTNGISAVQMCIRDSPGGQSGVPLMMATTSSGVAAVRSSATRSASTKIVAILPSSARCSSPTPAIPMTNSAGLPFQSTWPG